MEDQRPDTDAPIAEEIKTRPSCKACEGSMEGEHHRATTCKACKAKTAKPKKPKAVVVETEEAPDVVKVVPELPSMDEYQEERHNYWMGTTQDSPFQNVDAGGRSFPRASGQMTDNDGSGQPTFSGPRGTEAKLTAEEVNRIQKAVARKVVSWAGLGKNRRAVKRDMDALGFRQAPTDEPLGKYLFMHRTDSLGFKDKEGQPEPMIS